MEFSIAGRGPGSKYAVKNIFRILLHFLMYLHSIYGCSIYGSIYLATASLDWDMLD